MRGGKPAGSEMDPFTVLPAWQWTDPTYTFVVPGALANVASITLDPKHRLADMDLSNDRVQLPEGAEGMVKP